MPVNGPVLGGGPVGGGAVLDGGAAMGLSSPDMFTAAKTPPAIRTATAAIAPINTPRRRFGFATGGVGGTGGPPNCAATVGGTPTSVGNSWVCSGLPQADVIGGGC